MTLILPPDIDEADFQAALAECRHILTDQWVLDTDEDRDAYRDAYAFSESITHVPSGALAPENVEQIQEILKIANKYKIPIWPFSRGKNLNYGGSAPQMSGTLMLDLSRMNNILEVDLAGGYAIVEPGVGFFDLHRYLRENEIPLWISCPEHSWGSVMGNALDRGMGRTPYGEHSHSICGMEVVLPDSEIVRTGMGAMANSKTWGAYKNGFGPGWDQMFCQSNLGVVTKMGIWLMPQPQSTRTFRLGTKNNEDLEWLVETLIKLCRDGIIDQYFSIANFLPIAGILSQRIKWYDEEDSISESAIRKILEEFGLGWWNCEVTIYGPTEVVEAKSNIFKRAFSSQKSLKMVEFGWTDDQPLEESAMSTPSIEALQFVNWYGGRGGHMDFSPVLPTDTMEIVSHIRRTEALYKEAGQDYFCALHCKYRSAVCINALIFDRDDEVMEKRVKSLFSDLITVSAEHGYGEYRTHLDWMDRVASTYDYNDHALLKLNSRIKDLLDPNGILAPGKSGIWPKRYRKGD